MSVAFDLDDIGGENRRLNQQHHALVGRRLEIIAWANATASEPGVDMAWLNAVTGRENALIDADLALIDAARQLLDERIRNYGRNETGE